MKRFFKRLWVYITIMRYESGIDDLQWEKRKAEIHASICYSHKRGGPCIECKQRLSKIDAMIYSNINEIGRLRQQLRTVL